MKKSVFHNSFITFIRQVLSIVFGLLASIIIARSLGSEGQGQYTLAILLPTLLYTLLNSGISSSTVYFLGKDEFTIQEVYSTNLFTALLLSIISILVGAFIILFFRDYFFRDISIQLLFYSLLLLPLIYLQKNLQTIFQGKEEFKKYNFIILLNQFGLLFFSFVFLYFLKLGILGAILSFGCSQLIMLITSFYYLYQSYKLSWPQKYSVKYLKQVFIFGLKGHLSNILSFINYRVDMFLIAYYIDDISVGIYSVAVLLVERVWIVSESVSTVLYARVANIKSNMERNKFTSLAARNTIFISILVGILISFFANLIIVKFFGDDFKQSVIPFILMIPGIVIFTMSKVLANDFVGRGKPEINTYIASITAITNIILNFILIPYYGIKGAACATTISYILDALLKSTYFSIKNKIPFREFYVIKIIDFKLYKNGILNYLKK